MADPGAIAPSNTLNLLLSSSAFDWQQREVLMEAWALAEQSRIELMAGWRASQAQIRSPQNDTQAKTQLATQRCVEDYYVAKTEWAQRTDAWARERARRMQEERLRPVQVVVDEFPAAPEASAEEAEREAVVTKPELSSKRPSPAAPAVRVTQITTPASLVDAEEAAANAVSEAPPAAAATSAATATATVEIPFENAGPILLTPQATSTVTEASAIEREAIRSEVEPLSTNRSSTVTTAPAPAPQKVSLVSPKQKNTKKQRSEWLSSERAKKVTAQFALRP